MRATHLVLKSGAGHCFFVISTKPDLTDAERLRLERREGNEHVESSVPYGQLMHEAGFKGVEVSDVTPEYIVTIRAWKNEWEADSDALIELVGEEEYERRIRNRILDISNAEDGLLQRFRIFGAKA